MTECWDLINPMPMDKSDIMNLKKQGDNITAIYSDANKSVISLKVKYD